MKILSLSKHISSLTRNPQFPKFLNTTSSPADNYWTHLQNNSSNLEKTFHTVKDKLDSKCVTEVLQRCALDKPLLGLRFFIWSGLQQPRYRHSSFMYRQACRLFKINENQSVVTDLIEAIGLEGYSVSVKAFKMVLNLCREAKIANEGLWVLRKMKEFNCRPDTTSYNIVIMLLCENGDIDEADRLMKEMDSINLYPDIITCGSMVKGFCDVGRLDDACGLFKAMKNHSCNPNVVLYSSLLDGVCRFGSSTKALELLTEMEKVGGDCKPNTVTYTSVIQMFCDKGQTIEALTVIDRMVACGCAPNRVTVAALINKFCVDENIEEAYKFIDSVVERDYVSNSECYSSLVVSLLRIGKSKEAEEIFKRMLKNGVKPDGLASSMIIKGICSEGRVVVGFYLLDEIGKLGFVSSVDSDIYSIILVDLLKENHLVEAAKLAAVMVEKGIQLKAPYVDRVLEYLEHSGETKLVSYITKLGVSVDQMNGFLYLGCINKLILRNNTYKFWR